MDEDLAATLLAEVLEGEDMAGVRLRVGIGPEDGEDGKRMFRAKR